jgi:hypothetical protein
MQGSNVLSFTLNTSHGRIMKTTRSWKLEEDWEEDPSEGDDSTCWESFAFQQKSTFPHCITQFCKDRKIAHTHSTDRCYKLHPPKGKGAPGKDLTPFFSLKALKAKEKAMERAKANRAKAKVCKTKAAKGNNLRVRDAHLRTCATSASKQDTTKLNALSMRP